MATNLVYTVVIVHYNMLDMHDIVYVILYVCYIVCVCACVHAYVHVCTAYIVACTRVCVCSIYTVCTYV